MPKIAVFKFLTFYVFSYDAMNEPPHLHVAKEKGNRQWSAKIQLKTIKIVYKGSLPDRDLCKALRLIKNNQKILIDAFNKIIKGKKISTIKFQYYDNHT